jgi:hypothetical protein
MTRGDLKTSRTGSRAPIQILADYQTGDTRDRGLWHEYAGVTHGVTDGPSALPSMSPWNP